jgi:hypothetical protein
MQISIIFLNIGVNMGFFIYVNMKLVVAKVKEFLERLRSRMRDLSVKKTKPEPVDNYGKSRGQDVTSTTLIMNHSFDAAASSNIPCGMRNLREPFKIM